ncbi:MAG: hypothetical protein ACJKTH_01995 [Patescibacteria group bacterium UBA2163]
MQNVAIRLIFIVLLVIPIASSELLHAVIPHSHSSNTVIAEEMHTFFRHEEGDALALFDFIPFFFFVPLVVFFVSWRWRDLSARLIRSVHAERIALRRGILPYRCFG